MNVVLLCSSPALIATAREAVQCGQWNVRGHWASDEVLAAQLRSLFPHTQHCPQWDSLLALDGVEACVVCGDDPQFVEAARQLSVKGLPVLVVIDLDAPPSTQFAMTAVWQDHRAPVIPILGTGLLTPAVEALEQFQQIHRAAPVRIELVQTVPAPNSGEGLSEDAVDRHFFHAATVLWRMAGEFQDVTALRSGIRGDRSQQALVTLAGEHAIDASWTLVPGSDHVCRLTLHGPRQEAASSEWSPQERGTADLHVELQAVRAAAATPRGFQWTDLLRAGELANAAKSSATRRRTIRLQLEEGTERTQFKSQMTAVGCGVLLWAMFGSMLLMFAAVVLDPRDREYKTAAAQGFVVRRWEFAIDSDLLNPSGREHVQEIARRWSHSETAVLLETRHDDEPTTTQARVQEIVQRLESTGLREVRSRVVARPLTGQVYESLLRLGWLVVFIPLAVFLLCQGLIVAARGASSTQAMAC